MSETPSCDHDNLEFSPEVVTVTSPREFTYAMIAVRCADCRLMFHWRGISSGHPNANEPTVTADGYQLRAPIIAGPGAIVGLLERTGMGDKLIDPEITTPAEADNAIS